MRILSFLILAAFFVCSSTFAFAANVRFKLKAADTNGTDSAKQIDVADILHKLFKKNGSFEKQPLPKKVYISIVPTAGYTLSTGFTIGASSLTTFFTDSAHKANESVVNAQAFYDSRSQRTFITQSNIWIGGDQWKFVTDLRFTRYPDVTYGLGNNTKASNADSISFDYIRIYQTFLKKITKNLYAGAGVDLDYHYDIVDQNVIIKKPSAFKRYGETPFSRSAGYNLNALFDTRQNPVNPQRGMYVNVIFRDNMRAVSTSANWTSLQIDVRKYIKLSEHSNNVLALWSYSWAILGGKPPYLDLPSVGNDTYNNTGRGYAIDRYRGSTMLYLEGEYRFGITNNGLIGGVVFANVQSYSRTVTTNVKNVIPAAGPGIRIKINKHTNTNLAIDYGFGIGGSRGLFVNLGEVF